MCCVVKLHDRQAATVEDLIAMLPGVKPIPKPWYDDVKLDKCLCQIDVKKTLDRDNIHYHFDGVDYIITQ